MWPCASPLPVAPSAVLSPCQLLYCWGLVLPSVPRGVAATTRCRRGRRQTGRSALRCRYLKGREHLDEKTKVVDVAGDYMPRTYAIEDGQWVGGRQPPPDEEAGCDIQCGCVSGHTICGRTDSYAPWTGALAAEFKGASRRRAFLSVAWWQAGRNRTVVRQGRRQEPRPSFERLRQALGGRWRHMPCLCARIDRVAALGIKRCH